MIVSVVGRKLKSFLLLLLNVVKRCFCCLRKRRYSDTSLPISVAATDLPKQTNTNNIKVSLI